MQVLFIGIHILFFFFFSFWQALCIPCLPRRKFRRVQGTLSLSLPSPCRPATWVGLRFVYLDPRRMILGRGCVFIRQLTATGSPELHLQVSSSHGEGMEGSRGEGMEGSRGEGMEGWTHMLMDVAGHGPPEWTPSPARVSLSFTRDSELPGPVTLGGKPPCFLHLKWGSWQRSRSPFGKVFCRSQRPQRTRGPRFHFL